MLLHVRPGDSILLMFRRVLDCSQNQATVAEAQPVLSDFKHNQGRPTVVNLHPGYH